MKWQIKEFREISYREAVKWTLKSRNKSDE
jgi:hypothetical protein